MASPTLSVSRHISNYRWLICALLFFATTINYVDRQILSLVKEILDVQLKWTNEDFGRINGAFQGAYGIGLVGFGWFIDRFGTKIGYAADWSEYNNQQTGDAPGAVLFNLDPLWSDANIDFIGIDNYMPLADWRDGTAHLDRAQSSSIYDASYLQSNIRGGEDYDWHYASPADRDAQTR